MATVGKSAVAVSRKLRANQYWPPTQTSKVISLPGGRKKCFVFNGKSDRDGSLQPVLCVASRGNERLAFFDREEIVELERILDRVHEYTLLWERKASLNKEMSDEAIRRRMSVDDSIGVEL